MKYYENNTIFRYTWEQVTQGFWKRYPNPESSHVLSEDTLARSVQDGKLYTKRLLTKTNRVPKWGERFISNKTVEIVEESIVDPVAKTLVTYTQNVGYSRVMSVVEKVTYKQSEENGDWTVAERSAWIDSQVFGFSRAITAFGIDRFRKNCHKMAKGFEYVLANMFPSANSSSSQPVALNQASMKKEKLKDAARKASDLAKVQANTLFASCEPTDRIEK